MSVQYKCNIDLFDLIEKEKDKDCKEEYKIRIEENIKLIKEQLYQLFEKTFKNKNEIENTIILLNKVNEDISKITKDIDDYKKITNERIEKIFKLLINNVNVKNS
jgi:hypothetical protein